MHSFFSRLNVNETFNRFIWTKNWTVKKNKIVYFKSLQLFSLELYDMGWFWVNLIVSGNKIIYFSVRSMNDYSLYSDCYMVNIIIMVKNIDLLF